MKELSERQQQVYNFIWRYKEESGVCPSIADVAEGLKIAHTTAATYVEALKEKGCIKSDYGVPRSLQIVPLESINE